MSSRGEGTRDASEEAQDELFARLARRRTAGPLCVKAFCDDDALSKVMGKDFICGRNEVILIDAF